MNTNQIIGLVIGAVVVVGGGYYVMTGKVPMQQGASTNTETEQENTTGQTGTTGTKSTSGTTATAGKFDGSVAALIARGGQWKCSIDTSTDQTVSSGQVYVADGKFRGNFTTTVAGFGDVMSYMISDGTTMYTWSTASPTGFKMAASKSGTPGSTQTSGQGAIDANNSYSYVCEPWSVDMSMFTPPKNITFIAQ